MIRLSADYIITPLGEGVEANLAALRRGETRLRLHTHVHGEALMEPVMASLIEEERYRMAGYTLLESLCIRAIEGAVSGHISEEQLRDKRCLFILSSTKGDIWTPMAESAAHVAEYFGNSVPPVVVSTACTSGASAQIVGWRMIESGQYDRVVIVGCDVQCPFIVSGFQSFKALSTSPCRPFDKARDGLNAGEAAAVIVLERSEEEGWTLVGGSIHNDANHISGPSRTAEGSLRCLEDAMSRLSEAPTVVSVHGTGTPYNDEMESIALQRAGLSHTPVSALKGYYGHTMGAAGLLETILCLHALEQDSVLPALGYREQGTTYPVAISGEERTLPQGKSKSLIKLLSGFGGVNAAVAWEWGDGLKVKGDGLKVIGERRVVAEQRIEAPADLSGLYRQEIGDYPKFFKMDLLCRLGFTAVEMLLKQVRTQQPDFVLDPERCAIIVASRSASVKNDRDYQETIASPDNYYPSPALFVYTLPNIVAGEIAIRHHLYGETACYVLADKAELTPLVEATLAHTNTTQAIVAWLECPSKDEYMGMCELRILN